MPSLVGSEMCIRDRQTALQGTLKAEEIQANWSGDVIFKNVVWVGPDGKTIAEIPLATVSVNLFDALLKGGTGASVGDVVTVSYTHLTLPTIYPV